MKILQICEGMPGPNTIGGGSQVFYWQNLIALQQLGHDVHVLVFDAKQDGAEVNAQAASLSYATTVPPTPRSLDYLIARVFRAETLPFQFSDWGGLRAQIAAAVDRIKPDLIWADHIQSLLVTPKNLPIVYGHLDFLYQLQPVRRTAHKGRLRRPDAIRTAALERRELDLCRSARFAVSVSKTDLKIFEGIGVRAVYMPVVGGYIAPSEKRHAPVPRAFLFGRANTAMAMQRRNVRVDIWPHVGRDIAMEWHLVGDEPANKDETWRWFERNFTRHGYVADLSTVFSPGDLCLIPYREDTGFRAKFVTAAAHGLVNIGYEETFHCAPEFVPGENCLAARDGAHFGELLREYASDPSLRAKLSKASRALYDEKFTMRAQLPTYQHVLEQSG